MSTQIKLKPLTPAEELQFQEGLTKERDMLQNGMSEARHMRADLRLQSRLRYVDFQQKIGELSLTFGAAMVPLVLVTTAYIDLKNPGFVLTGAMVYLVNGVLALWQTKKKIEQDGEDSPFVGLDEEINTYPIINAKNKLILEPNNDDYASEHIKAESDFFTFNNSIEIAKNKPTFWVDALLFNFVLASLLIVGTIWPYCTVLYWLAVIMILLFIAVLVYADYKRALRNQKNLRAKHKKLTEIKSSYTKWRNEKLGIFKENK